MITIRKAVREDIPRLQDLLVQANVYEAGIEENLINFFVAEQLDPEKGAAVIGMVGLEQYDSYGMIRSLVIEKGNQSTKLVLKLIDIALNHGKTIGCETLYMVVGKSNALFEELGFQVTEKEKLPQEVLAASSHLQHVLAQGVPLVYYT